MIIHPGTVADLSCSHFGPASSPMGEGQREGRRKVRRAAQRSAGILMQPTRAAVFLVIIILAATTAFSAAAPERSKGISIHMLPQQVGDLRAQKWGFVVTYAEYLEPEKAQPVLQSATGFLTFVRKQKVAVQENGVWIVTTHPDAYSEPERQLLEDIKVLCRRERIPLFVVRGSQLPKGWQRYDHAP